MCPRWKTVIPTWNVLLLCVALSWNKNYLIETAAQNSCMTNCLQDFLRVSGASSGADGLSSWQHVLQLSEDATPQELKTKFDLMCQSYTTLKYCIRACPDASGQQSVVSNGFTSLQFVCEDRYSDFLRHLPCLVQNEKTVLTRCHQQTVRTTEAISELQQAAFDNDFRNLKSILVKLCSNTNEVIICMAPVTEQMCGREPSDMLKTLVSLGFRNTETLYTRLGLRHQLPDECISLGRDTISSSDDADNGALATVDPATGYFERQSPNVIKTVRYDNDAGSAKWNHPSPKTKFAHASNRPLSLATIILLKISLSGLQ